MKERREAPAPAIDRALATLAFRLQQRFARTLAGLPPVAPPDAGLAELRYGLRRDGLAATHARSCFAVYARASGAAAAPHVLSAALQLTHGGVVELAAQAERDQALAMAAFVHALQSDGVHLVSAGDAAAQRMAGVLRTPFAALGLPVGCVTRGMDRSARESAYASPVVCAPLREIAHDYLRDLLSSRGESPGRARRTLLRGLHCALVEDADLVLIDDAAVPVVIAADAPAAGERLLYEQAIELARALGAGSDFTVEAGELRLAPAAAERLERLVAPLGGAWSVRERRETLVLLALEALHGHARDRDYRVVERRVVFPQRAEDEEEPDEELKRLIEVKENCPLGARREVRARASLPRLLRRYLHLAGVAADCRGLERELWSLYSLKTKRAGEPPAPPACDARVFSAAEPRRNAVADAARAAAVQGNEVLVAARSPGEAEALRPLLAGAALAVFSPGQGVPPRRTDGPAELLVAELLDSRRHVGWLARAWGARRCRVFASLEDGAVSGGKSPALAEALRLVADAEGALPAWLSAWALRALQRAAEEANAALRAELAARELALEDLLALAGSRS